LFSFLKNKLFFSVDKIGVWFSIALVVKTIVFLFSISQHHFSDVVGFWGSLSGDAQTYLDPLENYIVSGNYDPDFRMPGLALVYVPFRYFFSIAFSCNALLIIQLILSAFSVYVLAKTVYNVSKSHFLFCFVFYSFVISTFSNIYDSYFLTESLCNSATIFFIYFLVEFRENKQNKYLFLCGIFFTWIVFLRPVYVLFFLLILGVLYQLYRHKSVTIKQTFVAFLFFSSSWIVIDSIWIVRNYKIHEKIIPLRTSIFYGSASNDYFENLARFVQSWGGDIMFWNPPAEIRWFNYKADFVKTDVQPQLPDYIFTSAFNMDTLQKLKQMITSSPEKHELPKELMAVNADINRRCLLYEESVRKEKPFLYYVWSGCVVFKKFLFHSGTYNLFKNKFSDLPLVEKAIKIFYEIEYWVFLVLSILATFIFPYKNKMFIFFFPVLYTFIVIPFGFKFNEYRYLVPAYPFMLVTACYLVYFYVPKLITFLKR
jgi:hypothetical protein